MHISPLYVTLSKARERERKRERETLKIVGCCEFRVVFVRAKLLVWT
jgi:hypothetical protein